MLNPFCIAKLVFFRSAGRVAHQLEQPLLVSLGNPVVPIASFDLMDSHIVGQRLQVLPQVRRIDEHIQVRCLDFLEVKGIHRHGCS